MNYTEQSKRYKNDAEFHYLVDRFRYLLLEGKFSINELKDAATFAANKFAIDNMRKDKKKGNDKK